MSTPIMTWSVVAGLMSAAAFARVTVGIWRGMRGERSRLFELGSEREEFFVPGDQYDADDLNDEGEYV